MALFHQDGCRGGIRAMLPVAFCQFTLANLHFENGYKQKTTSASLEKHSRREKKK